MQSSSETFFHVHHLGKLVASVLRAEHPIDNLAFITDEQQPLQVGVHDKPAGIQLKPHIHLSNTKVISEIQEVLYIISGRVLCTLYTIDGQVIERIELKTGDSIFLASMGHGFEFLEPTRIFEVKQGPYPGTEHAKIYFQGQT